MKLMKSKKSIKMKKLERIDENRVFIERPIMNKYNEYNQINIFEKLYEIYLFYIKLLNIKNNNNE